MKYMLVYRDDPSAEGLTEQDQDSYRQACDAWRAEMEQQSILLRTVGLMPPSDGLTVRVREGKMLVADGPFAETREQMGGVSLIECDSLDQAGEVAARHPWSAIGFVDVRPVRE